MFLCMGVRGLHEDRDLALLEELELLDALPGLLLETPQRSTSSRRGSC